MDQVADDDDQDQVERLHGTELAPADGSRDEQDQEEDDDGAKDEIHGPIDAEEPVWMLTGERRGGSGSSALGRPAPMATIDAAATVAQRVQELLDDRTVREDLRTAGRSSRAAYERAKRKKHKADAARDPLIRHRVKQAVLAGREVVEIAREGPGKRRRRRRRRRALGLLFVAGWVAALVTTWRNSR